MKMIMESLAMQLTNVNIDTDLKYIFIIVTASMLQIQKCMKAQNLSRKEIMKLWELIDEDIREEIGNKKVSQKQYNAVQV